MITKANFCNAVVEMIRQAETTLPRGVKSALELALYRERSSISKLQICQALENIKLAEQLSAPICSDTGTLSFFVKLGRGLELNFDLEGTILEAVAKATRDIPLRVNVVDPITRMPSVSNVGRAQPAIHIETVKGKNLQVDLLVNGAGTEARARLFMMRPTERLSAIEQAVLKILSEADGKPCAPNVVGVCIGGSMETAPFLAKRALLRCLDQPNPDPELRKLERHIEVEANKLGIGPMGLGGKTTVLKVLIEKAACHTATLPIAVALQCWPARRSRGKIIHGNFRVVRA